MPTEIRYPNKTAGFELGSEFASKSWTMMEYVVGGTVIVLEIFSPSSFLTRALNSSAVLLSLVRTTNSPLAGELVMKSPVMTILLPLVVTRTF